MKDREIVNYVNAQYDPLDKYIESRNSCCHKGCSHCCYQPIDIVNWEEVGISQFIKNDLHESSKVKFRHNLVKWADFFNSNYDDTLDYWDAKQDFSEKVADNNVPCPFLINDECGIYPVRPLACRAHIAVDSPDFCRADKLRKAPLEARRVRNEVFNALKQPRNSFLRYLPVAVAESLDLLSLFKPHKAVLL